MQGPCQASLCRSLSLSPLPPSSMRYSPLSCAADASRHGADLEAWPRTYSGESGQPPYPPLCGRFGFRVVPGPGYEHRAAARRLVHPAVGMRRVALRVAAGSPGGLGGGEEPAPGAAHREVLDPRRHACL